MKTAEDILPVLQRWVSVVTEVEEALAPLAEATGMDPECRLHGAIYGAVGLATEWAADKIGTSFDWLEWFWFENQMGERGFEAGCAGHDRAPIRTLEDFATLLAADVAASEKECVAS